MYVCIGQGSFVRVTAWQFLCIEAFVELFAASKIIKSGPLGHPNCADRSCDERRADRVLIKIRLCRRKKRDETRETIEKTGTGLLGPALSRVVHPPYKTPSASVCAFWNS